MGADYLFSTIAATLKLLLFSLLTTTGLSVAWLTLLVRSEQKYFLCGRQGY